jgi:hypothetical protein
MHGADGESRAGDNAVECGFERMGERPEPARGAKGPSVGKGSVGNYFVGNGGPGDSFAHDGKQL